MNGAEVIWGSGGFREGPDTSLDNEETESGARALLGLCHEYICLGKTIFVSGSLLASSRSKLRFQKHTGHVDRPVDFCFWWKGSLKTTAIQRNNSYGRLKPYHVPGLGPCGFSSGDHLTVMATLEMAGQLRKRGSLAREVG